MYLKSIPLILVLTTAAMHNLAFGEARKVDQNNGWELIEFYDGFDERVEGYSATTSDARLRLDAYPSEQPETDLFVILDVARDTRDGVIATIKNSYRRANPAYPRACDPLQKPDLCSNVQDVYYAAKLELKLEGGDAIALCGRKLEEQSGHTCLSATILGTCETLSGATPMAARECTEELNDGIEFHLPQKQVEAFLSGPQKLFARLTIYELDDFKAGAAVTRLRQIYMPSVSLTGATPIIRTLIDRAQDKGMLAQ